MSEIIDIPKCTTPPNSLSSSPIDESNIPECVSNLSNSNVEYVLSQTIERFTNIIIDNALI